MLVMLNATGLLGPTRHSTHNTAPLCLYVWHCQTMLSQFCMKGGKTLNASVGQEACRGREACRVCANPGSLGRA